MRILIVDDCELSAGMLAVVLEVYGHQVRLIRTPGAALRLAADFQPEIVLLTVGTPVSSSESDAARQLRAAADNEPQIYGLCRAPKKLSNREQCLFDRVFSRPIRFGQLKPFLGAPVATSRGNLNETVRSG